MRALYLSILLLSIPFLGQSQPGHIVSEIHKLTDKLEPQMIAWRHDIHQNPELSNREFKTAKKIASHLRSLGIEVQESVAKTGVIGILKGDQPGPVIALRADMDALPVTERVDLPWASKVTAVYNDKKTGVMHACGHDTHVASLMAAAEVLSEMKSDLRGTVKFVFQPAEEGAPTGEEGGAELMVKEGVLKNPDVDIMIGLHTKAEVPEGQVTYKPGGFLAAADRWTMVIKGKQAHGSTPWSSVDPIVTAAQIINGMQTVISRNAELTKEGAVLSVGYIQGGIRNNIIPEEVKMIGTIRTLDTDMQEKLHADFRRVAENIGRSMNAEVKLEITEGAPVTYNDPELTSSLIPFIEKTIGSENVKQQKAITGAEDFAYYANEVPSFFFFVGGCPEGKDPNEVAPHHTPDFFVPDSGMKTGLRAMLGATFGYMYHEE